MAPFTLFINSLIYFHWFIHSVAPQRIWKLGGGIFGRTPSLFLASKVQLVDLSAFVIVSTVWSVSCLLFFNLWCTCAQLFVKVEGHVPPWLGATESCANWRTHCRNVEIFKTYRHVKNLQKHKMHDTYKKTYENMPFTHPQNACFTFRQAALIYSRTSQYAATPDLRRIWIKPLTLKKWDNVCSIQNYLW